MNKNLKIIFLGTPDFAVASLQILVENGYNIVGVITAPDKQAGRGLQLQQSPVKKYALEKGLKVLQPEKLKSPDFLNEVKSLQADLQIVVAFRMMPEVLWSMPRLGTFNLHASLLPQYRGAAPINHVIMNGEKETGVTTFFLRHEIDTGDIIKVEKVKIGNSETAGELHDKLMIIGAQSVLQTVRKIESGNYTTTKQHHIPESELKFAPKIFKEHCHVNWNQNVEIIYNKIRGLSPYPTAYTELVSSENTVLSLKIYRIDKENSVHHGTPGSIYSDGKTFLKISCTDGWINIKELQLQGKNRMNIADFLRGFSINGYSVKN